MNLPIIRGVIDRRILVNYQVDPGVLACLGRTTWLAKPPSGCGVLWSDAPRRQITTRSVVAFLLDHGADPNAADGRGFTALHRAAEMGEKEIVRLLLDRGALPHPEAQGHTPRSLAAARGEQAIVELLDGW